MIAVANNRPRRVNFFMAPEFIPLCPVHRCDMVAYKSLKLLTYFHCPHVSCECTDRSPRKLFTAKRNDTSHGNTQ